MQTTSIQYLKGIGPKRAKSFTARGVNTIEELLYYFPRRYEDRTNFAEISQLKEGQIYNWLINPFERKQIFVLGERGEYVGKCARVDATNRMDTEEIGRAIGRAERDLNDALAPLAKRGAQIGRARVADLQHNAAVLKEAGKGALTPVPETHAKKDDRIANLARIALGRDVDVSIN